MDDRVLRLKTPKHCEIFQKNAMERDRPDLAEQARVRAVQLRAEEHGAETDAEKECLEAIYAYEEALTRRNGRRTRATRTWQMISRHGLLEAVQRAVNRPTETKGYRTLAEIGLQHFAFEAVVLRYPVLFNQDTIDLSRQRLSDWKDERTDNNQSSDSS